MNIPLVDLKAQLATIRDDVFQAMAEVVENTAFIKGRFAQAFESAFADFLGAKHCVGVGNGTDALVVALKALGLQPDDEVVVPAMTFIATGEAVTAAGGRVAFADIAPDTRCIDPAGVRAAITPKTKGIIAVHLYGHPADMRALRAIADEHGLWILEDCAQAHAAHIDERAIGTMGEMAAFSFFPGKNLGAYGDAGGIVTNDDELARKATMWANHGRIGKYDHEFEGYNSRLDGLQAAVLSVKLPHLRGWTESRRAVAAQYSAKLAPLQDKGLLTIPQDHEGHVYHLFVVQTDRRDELLAALKEAGIGAGVHYPTAMHTMPAYAYLGHVAQDFPVADKLAHTCLSLPVYPELSEEQIEYIVAHVSNFFA